jgi:hypothetical protein
MPLKEPHVCHYCGDCIEDGFHGSEDAGGGVGTAGCEETVDGGYGGRYVGVEEAAIS